MGISCGFCGDDLKGKQVSLVGSDTVCHTSCNLPCSSCREVQSFSMSCFSCKRNLFIINRMMKGLTSVTDIRDLDTLGLGDI
jgi:hypothetical protein